MADFTTSPTDDGGAITPPRALDADGDGRPDYSTPASIATREPLVIRGAIVAAVTALLHVLVVLGALPLDADAEQAVVLAVDMIGTAVLVVWTRGKVTPVADPRI